MMKKIRTHEMNPEALSEWERAQVYNALDTMVCHDVFAALQPQLDSVTRATYDFSRALQGPVLEMRCRGVLIDEARKEEVIDEYFELAERLEAQLSRIVLDGIGMDYFNWRSYVDVRSLLYRWLDLPPAMRDGRLTVDRGARERLQVYPAAEQIIKHINMLSELSDKISVLRTSVDDDGRIRTSYNIAGTDTGRFSSSTSEFGTGGNMQNITESLRSIFIADPGWKFAKADARSGESFCVGALEWNLFGDGRYLDACESGDPHTAVAKLVWPELGWTGEPQLDREIAEQLYYRHHSYRFTCKKLGHGSNYAGTPQTLSIEAKVPIGLVRKFQVLYFKAFPAHQRWLEWVESKIRTEGKLTSLTGRRRWFLGRRTDPKTVREAAAFDPQGSLADIVNTAMLQIWRRRTAVVMMQDHDALTFMYPEREEGRVIKELQQHLIVPVQLARGRTLRIPYDIQVGWNKAHASKDNPDGLMDWKGQDLRRRQRRQSLCLLDGVANVNNQRRVARWIG
jgi:DNA polymerase-1